LFIAGFLIVSIFKGDETFVYGYFIVGGWQIISMAIHFIMKWFCNKSSVRYNYQITVLIVILNSLIGLVFKQLLFFVLALLIVAAPFMAIYYTWICYYELYVKMQRPLALLK
jgi:hypothetical protein